MRTRQSIGEVFDQWAPTYDGCTLQPLYHAAHRAVLEEVGGLSARPHRVLDIGCGTGQLLRLLASHSPGLMTVGLDLSFGMVSRAGAGSYPCVGAAEQLPFRDAVFDLVVSTISIRHWTDHQAGLGEIRRVMTPGGQFTCATTIEFTDRRSVDRWRNRRRRAPTLDAVDFTAAGLAAVRVKRIGGYGPVPAIVLITARRPIHAT